MAVIVPILMAAGGVSTMATLVTAVAFQVTGINEKINNAASNVFGADLVKLGNLIGSVYSLTSGGVGGEGAGAAGAGPGIDAAVTAGDYVNSLDAASDAATAASGGGAASTAAAAGSGLPTDFNYVNGSDLASDAFSAAKSAQSNSFNLSKMTGPPDGADGGTQLGGVQQAAAGTASPTGSGQAGTQSSGTGTGATGAQSQAAGGGATASKATAPNATGSVFDRLGLTKGGGITDGAMRLGGAALQGAFGAYSAAQQRAVQEAQLDLQRAEQKYKQATANIGGAGWKQTQ